MKKILSLLLILALGLGLLAGPAPAEISQAYSYTRVYVHQVPDSAHGDVRDVLDEDNRQEYEDGSGDQQVDYVWHSQRNLAASTSENLDLAGGLTDALGSTLTFTAVKVFYVRNLSTTQTLTLGNAATDPWYSWASSSGDAVKVPPEGELLLTSPNAGFAVTGGTADTLKVLNSAGAAVDYVIVLVGD